MTILITGGAGFIGSHLCAHYTQGGQPVTVLDDLSSGKPSNFVDPQGVTLIEGDVADHALVAKLVADAEIVYHLAAIASVQVCAAQPERAARTNLAGTQAVFDAVAATQKATGRSIPVVYASSAAVYGNNNNIPLSEEEPPAPITAYGKHKLENECMAKRAFIEHGVRSVGLRFFNVYGPRQDPSSPYSGVISKFMERARAGQPLTIFGDGEQTRDFIYVKDVARQLVAAAAYALGDGVTRHALFNVGTGTATSLTALAAIIGGIAHPCPLALDFQPARAGDIRHSLADPARIMAAYGISGWTPLRDGLLATMNGARSHAA